MVPATDSAGNMGIAPTGAAGEIHRFVTRAGKAPLAALPANVIGRDVVRLRYQGDDPRNANTAGTLARFLCPSGVVNL